MSGVERARQWRALVVFALACGGSGALVTRDGKYCAAAVCAARDIAVARVVDSSHSQPKTVGRSTDSLPHAMH